MAKSSSIYETTFSKEVEYVLPEYISLGFILEMVGAIAERMKIKESEVIVGFTFESGAIIRASSVQNVERILKDSKKYNRHINGIDVRSEIVHESDDSDTHYSLEFRAHRYSGRFSGYIRAYGVAKIASESQKVIDWGGGVLSDFKNFDSRGVKIKGGEYTIQGKDGMVIIYPAATSIQKVEVVNEVGIKPSRWKDKQNVIGFIGIITAIVIAVLGWLYFR